jgi:hypothetical protein
MTNMTMTKIARCIAVGFLLAILSIGLLPFLSVYNFTEVTGLAEIDTSPLLLFVIKFMDGTKK